MNVASLELCKELYKLSGWTRTSVQANDIEKAWRPTPLASGENYRLISIGPNTAADIPAYDLGYLMRKMPFEIKDSEGNVYRLRGGKNQYYFFQYERTDNHKTLWWRISPFGKAPEDALCKLAIELFKQGILTSTTKGEK